MGSKQRKRRRSATLTILCVLILLVASSFMFRQKPEYKDFVTVTVFSGDSLWKYARENHGDMDVRKYVYLTKKINNIDNSIIYPGQVIKLPVISN